MPENVLNNTTNAAFIPTIIANKAIQRLGSYFQVAKSVAKDSDLTTATQGVTIQVPVLGAVVANDKTAGNVFTKQNPTATNVSVTLDKYKEVTITIDDFTKVAENQDTQEKYGNDGAIALAESVESALFALHPGITRTLTWDRTSAATIDASLLRIRKYFTDQKVPKLEQKHLVVDSTIYNDLLGQEKYTNASWRGSNDAVDNGQVIRVYGIDIAESQLVPLTGSPGAYHNLAFTKDAMVLASRPLPRPEGFGGKYAIVNDSSIGISLRTLFWYNADLGAHQLTLELLFGVAVIDQRRVVEVESF